MIWILHNGLYTRKDCDHDRQIVDSLLVHDEYFMRRLPIRPRPELVVDLGAHIGVWSHQYHKLNPEADIIAVEANFHNMELLEANVGSFARCIWGACAYNLGEEVKLLVGKDPAHGTRTEVLRIDRFLPPGQKPDFPDAAPNTAPTITLEEIVQGKTPDVIKIDVEGAEVNIFENTTILPRRLVIGEMHDDPQPLRNLLAQRFPDWLLQEVNLGAIFHLKNPREIGNVFP